MAACEATQSCTSDEEIRFSNLLDRGRKVLSHERFHKSLEDTDYEYLHETHGLPRELVDSLLQPSL